jgi:PTH1 family peptidyl-tRNA hydrolase
MDICIVGLGNPGSRYDRTRHNIGFRFVDWFADRQGMSWREKFNGLYGSLDWEGRKLYLLKPLKFMNLSGEVAAPFLNFHKIDIRHTIVVHDEIELPYGEVRVKNGGGHKGHNGLRDIIKCSGSADFMRIRCGVDRPDHRDVAGYVLAPFSNEEEAGMEDFLQRMESSMKDCLNKMVK